VINGAYYGLYTSEENVGHRLLKQFFPNDADGDLWKAGLDAKTNQATANTARRDAYWSAFSIDAVAAIVYLPGSVMEWASEALLNDADGYYGGTHNYYLYDEGARGLLFLPQDTDATFDWLGLFDAPEYDDHPIFWWSTRSYPAPFPGQHWLAVMNDAKWRSRYVDALASRLELWDVQQIQGWLDRWSKQIAADGAGDPHAAPSPDDFARAVAMARDVVAKRPVFLRSFIDCERGSGADADGDGVKWCDDCRDDMATVHPGAQEICGNQIDDDCDGAVDEGCP
jgi:hypothetical protein